MSSLVNIMDADETKNWVEQRSTVVAEWGHRMTGDGRLTEQGRHQNWNLRNWITAEAIEPGGEHMGRTLNLKSEDKGESPPADNTSFS